MICYGYVFTVTLVIFTWAVFCCDENRGAEIEYILTLYVKDFIAEENRDECIENKVQYSGFAFTSN